MLPACDLRKDGSKKDMNGYETVIGLEVHVELATASKMFCGCRTTFGAEPNTQVCPVCLGMPGVLPVPNRRAVELALRAALACESVITQRCRFARKNYFYPDLPKNYQISQYEEPIARGGRVLTGEAPVRLTRIHLEEDAGKLVHPTESAATSLVDFNRAGIPLLEIVTEPDIRSPEEAEQFLVSLKQMLEYLEVSDCVMEQGSLRCDANISVKAEGSDRLGTKVEVKNLNSFRAVRRALAFEQQRQQRLVREGNAVRQETRLWDEEAQATVPMRTKEQAHDYRYFPEPDLVPVEVSADWLNRVRQTVGELPVRRRERFEKEFGLSAYDAGLITATRATADYFEECVQRCPHPKAVANWITGELAALLKEQDRTVSDCPVSPASLAELVCLAVSGQVTGTVAKEVLRESFLTGKPPGAIVREKNLGRIDDEKALREAVCRAMEAHPQAVNDFLSGKKESLGFLIGQVMRLTGGKANPALVRRLLSEALENNPRSRVQ